MRDSSFPAAWSLWALGVVIAGVFAMHGLAAHGAAHAGHLSAGTVSAMGLTGPVESQHHSHDHDARPGSDAADDVAAAAAPVTDGVHGASDAITALAGWCLAVLAGALWWWLGNSGRRSVVVPPRMLVVPHHRYRAVAGAVRARSPGLLRC